MGSFTATAAAIWIQQPPAIFDGHFSGLKKHTGPSCVHLYSKLQIFNSCRMELQVKCSSRRVPITNASWTNSTSLICRAGPVGALETRPVTIKSPSEAPIGLVTTPKLDDGGTGFPPRDDGGGGGGGGGGGSSSGGFYLFAFLLFLSYLKDLEAERES